MDASLRESEERFRHVVENIREVFFILTPGTGQMEYISPAYDEIWGRSGSELSERPAAWLEAVHPEDRERVAGILAESLRGVSTEMEYRIVRLNGDVRWIAARSFPARDSAGRCVRVVGIAEDVTVRIERERALEEAHYRLDQELTAAREQAEEHAALTELLDILQSCQSVEEAYGIVANGLPAVLGGGRGALAVTSPSRNLVEVVSEWGAEPATRRTFAPQECWALRRGKLHSVGQPDSPTRCAHVEEDPSGGYVCVPLAAQGETMGVLYIEGPSPASPAPADHGKALCRKASALGERMSLVLANIQLRDALRAQSIRDPLTGLFNRRYMEESLEREVQRAVRNNESVAVLMIDLDRFKQFNDMFGHLAGDAVLRALGDLLAKTTRGQDVACRYGGEEFALILSGASAEAARVRAEELHRDLKGLIVQHAGNVLGRVTLSIGGAAFPEHATAEDLLRAADEALYRAKAEGRDRFVIL